MCIKVKCMSKTLFNVQCTIFSTSTLCFQYFLCLRLEKFYYCICYVNLLHKYILSHTLFSSNSFYDFFLIYIIEILEIFLNFHHDSFSTQGIPLQHGMLSIFYRELLMVILWFSTKDFRFFSIRFETQQLYSTYYMFILFHMNSIFLNI